MNKNSILEQLDIVAVVQNCLSLERKGNNYVGLCPFHDDSKPSLFVSESKQIFKCFVCNIGGDAVKFWMRFYNYSFKKAITTLAQQFNLRLEKQWTTKIQNTAIDKEITNINGEASIFFQFNLINHAPKAVHDYCQRRGLNTTIINKFEIGWIGDDEKQFWAYLEKKKYPDVNILNSDLFHLNDKEQKISYFRNRLMFPIRDEDGNYIGFVGRTINDIKDEPKYLNSKENRVFSKSQCFYNLYHVKKNFKAVQEIYLTEGLLDSIRLIEAGFPSIALMGTSLSKEQITTLKEQDVKIIIFPDNDEAGKQSAIKNSLMLLQNGLPTTIIDQDVAKDADECLQRQDFQMAQVKQLDAISFLIKQYPSTSSHERITQLITTIKPFLIHLNKIQKFQIETTIHKKYHLPPEVWTTKIVQPATTQSKSTTISQNIGSPKMWKTLLFARMLYHPEILHQTKVLKGTFNNLDYDFYYEKLIKWCKIREQAKKTIFFGDFITTLATNQQIWLTNFYEKHKERVEVKDINPVFTNDCLKKFQTEWLNIEIDKLTKQLQKKPKDSTKILEAIIELRNKRNTINGG